MLHKTDLVVFRQSNSNHLQSLSLNIDGCLIAMSPHMKNLVVVFDVESYIRIITKATFFHLHNIAKSHPVSSLCNAEIILYALVSSRLDYCNSLFSGFNKCATRSLQVVKNSTTRILTRTNKLALLPFIVKCIGSMFSW